MTALRVLVVEDDAVIGLLMAELLADLGHDVCAVEATGAGAVAAAARHKPELMIVDLHLTDGSGQSAVERITRTGPVPHFFVSGDRTQMTVPGALVLHKPFREADLVQAIGRTLGVAGV